MASRDDIVAILYVEGGAESAVPIDLLEHDERFVVRTVEHPGGLVTRLAEGEGDCVVSSYNLPKQTGVELCAAIRNARFDIPFVLVIEDDNVGVAREARREGVTDYVFLDSIDKNPERFGARLDSAIEHGRVNRELERKHEFLQAIQSISNVGGWEYDPNSGKAYITDETLRIHGLDPDDELTPERSIDYYHPADRQTVRSAFERLLESGESYDLELRLIDEAGALRWIRTRGSATFNDGMCVQARGTIQDITDRKEREQTLERQVDRLEEFAGVVSHDLRNPLNVARGELERVQDDGGGGQLAIVAESLERMEAVIEDTLTLAREGKTVTETSPVSIAEIVDRARTGVESSELHVELTDEFTVEGDRNRLLHVFENLFRNAVEHAHDDSQTDTRHEPKCTPTSRQAFPVDPSEDSPLTVRVGPINALHTNTRASADSIDGFYVEDNGPGIPEEQREEVFDAGWTTNENGTGFGLSIVKRIAEAHGWVVKLTEGASGGARFEFTGVKIHG